MSNKCNARFRHQLGKVSPRRKPTTKNTCQWVNKVGTTHDALMEFPYYHRPNVSQLETYRTEIVAMRASNWPFHKVVQWLDEHHQVKVSKEAVRQFCKVRSIGYLPNPATSAKTGTTSKRQPGKFEFDHSQPIRTRRNERQ